MIKNGKYWQTVLICCCLSHEIYWILDQISGWVRCLSRFLLLGLGTYLENLVFLPWTYHVSPRGAFSQMAKTCTGLSHPEQNSHFPLIFSFAGTH